MLANVIIQTFEDGGWVMWPIFATLLLAVAVVMDRALWWLRFRSSLRVSDQERAREAVGAGGFGDAWTLSSTSPDPFLGILASGLAHSRTSMLAAMQLDASRVLDQAEARMWVLSTIITLAPLLGLFGTVVGIMGSFSVIGEEQLAATKVSGGIAEALIATACGIAIAILCLLPYNFFRKRVASLRGQLERWINHLELLTHSAREHGHDITGFTPENSPS